MASRTHLGVATTLLLVLVYASANGATLPPTLNDSMKDVVVPDAQILWDVTDRAQDKDGNPDSSKLTSADWQRMATAAEAIRDGAAKLAKSAHVKVAADAVKIQSEGESKALGAKEVQTLIDRDPKAFAVRAEVLAKAGDSMISAIKSRNFNKVADVAGGLNEVCGSCHAQFWYPNAKTK